jgi:O-antigen ligase
MSSRLARSGVTPAQLGWTLAVALTLGAVFGKTELWAIPFGLIAAAALLAFGLTRPALFVTIFLIARPLVDHYSDKTVGGPGMNVGGLLGALVVVVALAYALVTPRLSRPRGAPAFVLLLSLTAIFGVLAFLNLRGGIGLRPVSEFVRLLALFAMYFLATNLFDTVDKARRIIIIVGLSALVPAIIGLVQLINGVAPPENGTTEVGRIGGSFSGPNPFGTYLALGALVLIALPKRYMPTLLRLAAIAVMAVALVNTYSRVGYILFLGGVLLLGWRVKRAAAVMTVVAAVIVVFAVPSVHDRVLPKADPAAQNEQTYESFSWRIDNWKGLLAQWEKSPVVGYGVETVPFVNPRVVSTGASDRFGGGFDAHNLAVKSLVEGGIVYLLGWALLLGTFIAISLRLSRDDWPLRQMGRLLAIVWPLVALISVSTAEPTSESASMFALLAATGALEGAHRTWRREQAEIRHRELQVPLQPDAEPEPEPVPAPPQQLAPA